MQPGDALNVVAQVAVTLAGFAGIVVVFRPESVHQWSTLNKFRLRLLLLNAALPLAYALFGIFLLSIDPPPVAIWRWCSGFTVTTQIVFIISIRSPMRSIPPAEFQSMSKVMFYSASVVGCITMGLQVINVALLNRFWPFSAALCAHLVLAIAQFVRMILIAPERG